jgi:beta-galactosidase
VVYLGTRLDGEALGGLLGELLGQRADGGTPGVERVLRRTSGASYEFLINRGGEPVPVTLAEGGRDLLSGTAVSGQLELPPQGVAIIRREN